jgi:ABC-type nitrate/sulfonate/bicarbonate transport system substrate-binding protein
MRIAMALAGVALVMIGAGGAAAAAELATLRYAVGPYAAGVNELPRVIGERKGFFAREGIRIEVVTETRGNAAAAEQGFNPSLERGGTAGMAQVPTGTHIQAVLNGSNTVAVSAPIANPVYSLIVRPEIRTYADLKGKEVTMTGAWDTITVTARKLLALHGVGQSDFIFKPIGGSEARLECMRTATCAATVLGQPSDLDAIKSGFHRLGFVSEAGPIIFNIEIVNRDWAAANRNTIVRYLRASAASMRYINDPKNRAEITTLVSELAKTSPDGVGEIVAHMFDPKLHVLTRNAELDIGHLQHFLDLLRETGVYTSALPPAERFADLSYAREAGIR